MKRSTLWRAVRIVLLVVCVVQAVYYARAESREHRLLASLVRDGVGATRGADDALVRTTALAFHIPPHRGVNVDYGNRNPLMKLLRPSAYQVYEHGGHCAKRSRLLVQLLETQGIEAHKLYLYNPLGLKELDDPPRAWVHVVVEAKVGGRWVVADPLFDLVFRLRDSTLATASDLARDTTLLREWRLRADERYDVWMDHLYFYDDVRRLPWFMLPRLGEPLYRMFVSGFGAATVNSWSEPNWMERPQLQIAVVSSVVALLLLLSLWPRRRARAPGD